MKELSIEEKAKRYDNIIEKANKMHHENCEACQMCIEELIPELKESEDERIRKELIAYLKNRDYDIDDKWIAWLEKQAEQKPVGFNIGDEITVNGQVCRVVAVDKPVWSEEDEKMLVGCVQAMCTPDAYSLNDRINFEYWLKSLKDRVQPKQEWSEEDGKMIGNIRRIIEKYAFSQSAVDVNGDLCKKEYIDADNWLKSLRPQNTWKPNDEQIKALEVECMAHFNYDLCRLYEQLKKLREE